MSTVLPILALPFLAAVMVALLVGVWISESRADRKEKRSKRPPPEARP